MILHLQKCELIGLEYGARKGESEPNEHKPHTAKARQWLASHDMRELRDVQKTCWGMVLRKQVSE